MAILQYYSLWAKEDTDRTGIIVVRLFRENEIVLWPVDWEGISWGRSGRSVSDRIHAKRGVSAMNRFHFRCLSKVYERVIKRVTHEDAGSGNCVYELPNPAKRAALKAARKLEPADSEADATTEEFRLRERGTHKLHIYEGWAWREDAPNDSPDWMPETITEANVSKQRIEHLEEL